MRRIRTVGIIAASLAMLGLGIGLFLDLREGEPQVQDQATEAGTPPTTAAPQVSRSPAPLDVPAQGGPVEGLDAEKVQRLFRNYLIDQGFQEHYYRQLEDRASRLLAAGRPLLDPLPGRLEGFNSRNSVIGPLAEQDFPGIFVGSATHLANTLHACAKNFFTPLDDSGWDDPSLLLLLDFRPTDFAPDIWIRYFTNLDPRELPQEWLVRIRGRWIQIITDRALLLQELDSMQFAQTYTLRDLGLNPTDYLTLRSYIPELESLHAAIRSLEMEYPLMLKTELSAAGFTIVRPFGG